MLGEFDLHTSPSIKKLVGQAAVESIDGLIVDMSDLSFFDCSAVSALMSIHAILGEGREMAIVCRPGRLRRILGITAMDQAVPVVPSVAEAVLILRLRRKSRDSGPL
jgi:anti-anti-sigma factor